jgi:hypothetical protein
MLRPSNRQIRGLERAVIAAAKPKKFGHTYDKGVETLWMVGRSSPRMIHGIASTPTIDSQGHSLLSSGAQFRLPLPLLSQHGSQGKGVGEVTLVRTSKTEVYIQAALNNSAAADYAWALIENGEVRALSVGWNPISVQAEVDKITFYDRWSIREISMVRTGANPDCRFEIFENGATWPFR